MKEYKSKKYDVGGYLEFKINATVNEVNVVKANLLRRDKDSKTWLTRSPSRIICLEMDGAMALRDVLNKIYDDNENTKKNSDAKTIEKCVRSILDGIVDGGDIDFDSLDTILKLTGSKKSAEDLLY